MNKKMLLFGVAIILLSTWCFCSLDSRKLLLGCYWQDCVPDRDFHVRDWKIPSEYFPKGSKVSEMMISSEGAGEIERGSQNIFWDNGNGTSLYNIYRYLTIRSASKEYDSILSRMVDDGTNKVWTKPKEINFSSSTADEVFVACGIWITHRCGMLARYQEYVILLTVDMDEKMTYLEFEKIAIYLDTEISSRLYQ